MSVNERHSSLLCAFRLVSFPAHFVHMSFTPRSVTVGSREAEGNEVGTVRGPRGSSDSRLFTFAVRPLHRVSPALRAPVPHSTRHSPFLVSFGAGGPPERSGGGERDERDEKVTSEPTPLLSLFISVRSRRGSCSARSARSRLRRVCDEMSETTTEGRR